MKINFSKYVNDSERRNIDVIVSAKNEELLQNICSKLEEQTEIEFVWETMIEDNGQVEVIGVLPFAYGFMNETKKDIKDIFKNIKKEMK